VPALLQKYLVACAWNPKRQNVIVARDAEGGLALVEMDERFSPSWSSRNRLLWTLDNRMHSLQSTSDVGCVMRRRLESNYGHSQPLDQNALLVAEEQPAAATAWSWLQHCDNLIKDPGFKNKFVSEVAESHPGVRAALAGSCGGPASEIRYLSWNAAQADKFVSHDVAILY